MGREGTGGGREGMREDAGWSRKGDGRGGWKMGREGNWRGERREEGRCRME